MTTDDSRTITFQPEDDVKTMLARATGETKGKSAPRGIRTFIINKALREWLQKQGYSRKKEALLV